MYFPYLRGKQFELIALREMANFMGDNSSLISPVIEPVKLSSTLEKTLIELANNNVNFTIIINPQVGKLKVNSIIELLEKSLSEKNNFQLGLIIKQKANKLKSCYTFLKDSNLDYKGFTLIYEFVASSENINNIEKAFTEFKPIINNTINFDKTISNRRFYRKFDSLTRISLADYFKSLERNSDYLKVPESEFMEEHLFFKEEGFKGFGDFLTIGEKYSESGFLPYAVSIHLSYAHPDKVIKVRHFTSNSNDGTEDPGGKFLEAIAKLVEWVDKENITETAGIKEFKDLHERGHFPGLGVTKKLSAMNHIELVIKLLQDELL